MRLAKLELLAYGPFHGLTLDFSAPGLHVILGRNEAGKSTTLRAITGLFYGIDPKTPDAHVHKFPDLRIGGVFESPSGERVRLVRRKGNTNTLLDEHDKPADESILKKLLGGVSKETFLHAFGIDHVTLEAGARALISGKGDLGEGLFDASVGGGGEVQRLRAHLEAEAEKIYKPRASTLPLNEALKAFADAQKSVREKQSLPEAFLNQERGLEEAVKDRDAANAAMKLLETRRARIERARRRVPVERRLERARVRRTDFGAVATQVARVEALKARFVAYDRALDHQRSLRAEAERLGDQVVEAARRAGLAAARETEQLREDLRKDARAHALLAERTTLTERMEAAGVEIVRLEREIARLGEVERGVVSEPAAPVAVSTAGTQELALALERARALGEIEARMVRETARADRARQELEGKVATLGRFEGALDAFVALRLPSNVSVQRLEQQFEAIERTVARLDERAAGLANEAASLEKQIAALTGAFSPPDAPLLRKARVARDEAWRIVRAASDPAARASAEVTMDGLLRDADALADQMIAAADRVTTLARLHSEAEANVRHIAKVNEEKAGATDEHAALGVELERLFADVPIARFSSAAEASAWLSFHGQINVAHADLRELRAVASEEEAKVSDAKTALVAALVHVGSAVPEASKLPDLVLLASRGLDELERRRRAVEDASRALIEGRAKLDERVALRSRDTASLADVNTKLAGVLGPLGIATDASAEEVIRSIEALRELFVVVDRRADAEARAARAAADVQSFETDLARAVTELAPDLVAMAPRDAASLLFERGVAARDNAHELATAEEELAREAEVVLDDADRELLADDDAAAQAGEELLERIQEAHDDASRATEKIGSLRGGLETMRAETHAAEAAARAEEALTRVRENAERWCRVRLAGHLLAREIERYREENQGPLLQASSRLFAQLTRGAYSGVKAGFDDKDLPCLRCVRANGVEVDPVNLSDGTRDSLYLSLRLASLVCRADVAAPMPLVMDDVLIQLDDERASAALVALADLAKRMQVLFFTHHARLVELARAALAPGDLVVHELVSELPQRDGVSASAPG